MLALTARGLALLKDESSVPGLTLARQRAPRKDEPRVLSRAEAESWQDVDRDLFERLRAVRLEIARARGVPPYVIFHDATLREMARLRPSNRSTRCSPSRASVHARPTTSASSSSPPSGAHAVSCGFRLQAEAFGLSAASSG